MAREYGVSLSVRGSHSDYKDHYICLAWWRFRNSTSYPLLCRYVESWLDVCALIEEQELRPR